MPKPQKAFHLILVTVVVTAALAALAVQSTRALPPKPQYLAISGLWSDDSPNSEQGNRSSGNFTTERLPSPQGQTCSVYKADGSQDSGSGISFDLVHDCGSCADYAIEKGVSDAKVIEFFSYRNRNLYIANPRGARDNFFVELVGQYNRDQVPFHSGTRPSENKFPTNLLGFALSLPGPESDHNHRSSGNFTTEIQHRSPTGLRWEIRWAAPNVDPWNGQPATGITVDVKQDQSAMVDPTPFPGIKHGSTTDYQSYRRVYVANPTGADGSFWVLVYFN